jgi:hypothetical protein
MNSTKPPKKGSISSRRKQILEEHENQKLENLTIAERLTRRAQRKTTSITLEDDEGTFTIEMFQPTRKELDELLKCQADLQNVKTQEKAYETLYNLLAELCRDDTLDYDFWKEGAYGLTDLMDIINTLFGNVLTKYQEIQQAQSFRKNGDGTGTVPAMLQDGEVPA